jgi:hypothetical protein
LEEGSGAPRYLVKPYSIALAVSVVEAAFLFGVDLWSGGGRKTLFLWTLKMIVDISFKNSILWH